MFPLYGSTCDTIKEHSPVDANLWRKKDMTLRYHHMNNRAMKRLTLCKEEII